MPRHDDPTLPPTPPSPTPWPVVGQRPEHERIGGLAGETVGPYRVIALLGEGGFGSVYLAEQSEPVRRKVALKVIKPGMDSRQVLARFEAERQALAMMDHPGVAKVFDAGVTPASLGSRPYFVMELVKGEPIGKFCRAERLGVPERVRLMIRVCTAVQHAHQKGIIHRDLKPANILVELVDGKPSPKIIDFGVAKAVGRDLTQSTLHTEQGMMIGTPEYMSPEQARGSAVDVDTRTDVYSLGAILYELLTGATPLDGREIRAAGYEGARRFIQEQSPARPSERVTREFGKAAEGEGTWADGQKIDSATLSRRLRGDLDWIAMKCLEKERGRRYDSAGALGRDLERFLKNEPVEAGPPSAAYRASKFVRRHRAAVIGASALVLALTAGIIGTGWGLSRAVTEREAAILSGKEADAARRAAEQHARAAEAARDEAESVTSFLSDMLEAIEPDERGKDVKVRQVLDRSGARIAEAMHEQPLVEARLRHTIGNAYVALGLLDDADKHLPAALAIREKTVGANDLQTLKAMSNVAGLRHAQGRYDEAAALWRKALDGYARLGPVGELDAIGVRNNLAATYVRMGRMDDAVQMQQSVVAAYEKAVGAEHRHTLGARINLASMYENAGKLQEARGILEPTVESFRRVHGVEHTGTLLAMHNLGLLCLSLPDYAKAESLFRQVTEIRTRTLGDAHADTARAMGNLGLALAKLKRGKDAEAVYVKAWEQLRAALGAEHQDTLVVAMNLMSLYEAAGWPQGDAVREERLKGLLVSLRSVSARASATPEQLNSCAWLLLTVEPASLQDAAAALPAAVRACEKERAAKGKDLWQYLDTLALAQFRTGAPASAAASQKEAISLVPKEGEGFREEMEGRLRQYEAASKGG